MSSSHFFTTTNRLAGGCFVDRNGEAAEFPFQAVGRELSLNPPLAASVSWDDIQSLVSADEPEASALWLDDSCLLISHPGHNLVEYQYIIGGIYFGQVTAMPHRGRPVSLYLEYFVERILTWRSFSPERSLIIEGLGGERRGWEHLDGERLGGERPLNLSPDCFSNLLSSGFVCPTGESVEFGRRTNSVDLFHFTLSAEQTAMIMAHPGPLCVTFIFCEFRWDPSALSGQSISSLPEESNLLLWDCTGAEGILKSSHCLREFAADVTDTDQEHFLRLTSSLRYNSRLVALSVSFFPSTDDNDDSRPYIWSDWGNFWAAIGHHPSLEQVRIWIRDCKSEPRVDHLYPIMSALHANPRLQRLTIEFIRCEKPEWFDSVWNQQIVLLLQHNKYRPRLAALCADSTPAPALFEEGKVDALDTDLLASILSYLVWTDVLKARVCKKWKLAAEVTPVKSLRLITGDMGRNILWIPRALPNLQTVEIDFLNDRTWAAGFPITEGEGYVPQARVFPITEGERDLPRPRIVPPRVARRFPNLFAQPAVNISPIQNFTVLRHLDLKGTRLRGQYPYLFQFQNLKSLNLSANRLLVWDLDMLSGVPNLEKLHCERNEMLTGSLRSVRVLRNTLKELDMYHCSNVEGSLGELYDFPLLEDLDVCDTEVTGDIRTIGISDLEALKRLGIGEGVYGGGGNLQSVQEAPSMMKARHHLVKRTPTLFKYTHWRLSDDSPERYHIAGHLSRRPPFSVEFVFVGPRVGWIWTNRHVGGHCDIYWLDPAPIPADDCYEEYKTQLQEIDERQDNLFKGLTRPPTAQEYEQRAAEFPLDPLIARNSSRLEFGVW